MRRLIRVLGICVSLFFFALPAMADALDDAKASGRLGEGPDGYLHVVTSGAVEKALAVDINAKRKARYQQIATKEGVPLKSVEVQAGKRLSARASAGEYVMDAAGKWTQK